MESSLSEFLDVQWGVPQGSILGPLLFLIFINELPEITLNNDQTNIENSSIVIFADDNTPSTSEIHPTVLKENIQKIGDNVTKWFESNEMVCSSDKTKLLIIGTKANRKSKLENDNMKIQVRVCGDIIEESQSEKLLGIIVNNNLNWKDHLHGNKENTGLLTKLSRTVGVLKKMRKIMPIKIFKQSVSSIFTSKLIYCLTVWGGIWNLPGNHQHKQMSISKENMRKLQVLTNKIMRIESGSDYETATSKMQPTQCTSANSIP